MLSQRLNTQPTNVKRRPTAPMTFDPTASKYQVSPEFGPDKTNTWSFPPEEDGWMYAHNAIRGELLILKETVCLLEAKDKVEDWMIDGIQSMWKVHSVHLHSHHKSEDDNLAPNCDKRFKYPEKHVEDHLGLVKALDKVGELIKGLESSNIKVDLQKIAHALALYEDIVLPHLKLEEEIGLLLFRAYFSPEEARAIIEQILKKSPSTEMGSFIYFVGVNEFRKTFMPREGIPFFIWYLQFRSNYADFVRDFTRHSEAIKAGQAPKKQKIFWLF